MLEPALWVPASSRPPGFCPDPVPIFSPRQPFERLQGREGTDVNEDASDGKEKREGGLRGVFPIA